MPYYLLIVADPETVPYEFQYQLDVQYAVGRIWFETIEQYRRYAQSVVDTETSGGPQSRTAAFFSPKHGNDPASELSACSLTAPLAKWASEHHPDWDVSTFVGKTATRDRLRRLLGGEESPAFLFTAGHGVGYDPGDPRQLSRQGSLVCQDWPGKGTPLADSYLFTADDVADGARIKGMIAFFFACNSAGTSHLNDLAGQPKELAHKAFVAKLPQRLLGHENGSALAVIGHIGGACKSSIAWPGGGQQTAAFEDAVTRLMKGRPVGFAVEPFNERHADLSVSLSDLQQDAEWGIELPADQLAAMYSIRNDARNYVVLGDPAVRLAV
jgi:hypothetical protein